MRRSTILSTAALALLVVLATLLGAQSATPTQVAPFVDRPGLARGFNNLEQSPRGDFRWTEQAAQVCLPQAGWAARSIVDVRLAGEYAFALGVRQASIQVNAAPPLVIALTPELRRYRVLGGGDRQASADLCTTISAEAVNDPNNNRQLGVPFYGVTFRQLPAAGLIIPAPAQVLLNLTLAGFALALLRLLAVPALIAYGVTALAALLPAVLLFADVLPAGPGLVSLQVPLLFGVGAAVFGLLGARRLVDWPPLGRIFAAMAFWSLVLYVGFRLVQMVNGHSSVWPLKAGFAPNPLTPLILLPIALCLGWLWLLVHRPIRRPWPAVALLLIGAVLIPVTLEVSILGWDALYEVFRDSPYDYLRDTPRVADDPLGFLRDYVTIAPTLALHSSTHPPGSILLLWLVERIAGPGPIATSWAAIILSATLPLAAFWLGLRLGDLRLGLLAGAICTLMPGHMIYAVTSMDGLFNGLIALSAVAFFLALEPPARPQAALLAGMLISLALFFTYATTQLFFFGLAAAALAWYRRPGRASFGQIVRQGGIAAATIVVLYLALYLITGFNVILGSAEATAENAQAMGRWLYGQVERPFAPPSMDYYLVFLGANIAAYAWFLAPWGLAALGSELQLALRRGWRQVDAPGALLLASGLCVVGMWLSGLFNREVERIWAFTYPLAAVLIAQHIRRGDPRAQRWWVWIYPLLFFAFSALLKLLLNTVW